MKSLGNGFPSSTPFYQLDNQDDSWWKEEWWKDPEVCPPELSEEDCKYTAQAVDITLIMAALDCTEQDMSDVLEDLFKLLTGEISEIDHVCMNGNRIRIAMTPNGELEIETDPPVEFE